MASLVAPRTLTDLRRNNGPLIFLRPIRREGLRRAVCDLVQTRLLLSEALTTGEVARFDDLQRHTVRCAHVQVHAQFTKIPRISRLFDASRSLAAATNQIVARHGA
jgi:hypothetical protein